MTMLLLTASWFHLHQHNSFGSYIYGNFGATPSLLMAELLLVPCTADPARIPFGSPTAHPTAMIDGELVTTSDIGGLSGTLSVGRCW